MAASLSEGNNAIALLGSTLATGCILYVLITVLGPISGAHFNPAVTLGFFLQKQVTAQLACLYLLVQAIGGVLGVWLAHLMFELPIWQIGTNARTGVAQWISEGVATFGLVFVILAGLKFRPQAVAALVGIYISAGYWFTASTSFANPAVSLARSWTDTFSGIDPYHMPAFIVAQIVGAIVAVLVYKWLIPSPATQDS